MTKVKLREATSLEGGGGKTWLVQLISAGIGSSATYPADILERDGASAFPRGTQVFLDHLTDEEDWQRDGSHSIKDLVGVTLEDATYEPATESLRAPVKWFNGFESFIEEAKDFIGLSVEVFAVMAEGVAESLVPSPFNAVAVVPRAGRDGKVLHSLIESYRETHDSITPDDNTETGKGSNVTPEEIKALVESLVEPIVKGVTEGLKPADPAPEAEPTVSGADVVEAALAEGLSKTARARVLAAVEGGAALTEAIATEKALRDEILAEAEKVTESAGKIKTVTVDDGDFKVGGW